MLAAQELSGSWVVEPNPGVRDGKSLGATRLRYEVSVAPKWAIPASLVSALVRAGLPANICAVAERAEQVRSWWFGWVLTGRQHLTVAERAGRAEQVFS